MARGSKRQRGGGVGIAGHDGLVAAHPGVVVDVARLGHAHRRVDQEVGLDLAGRPQRQLDVRPVHGVAGLEGDHPVPGQLTKAGPQLGRAEAQRLVVVVGRQGQHFELPGDVDRPGAVEQVGDARVAPVGRAEDELGLLVPVGPVELAHMEHAEHDPLRVPEGQVGARRRSRPPFPR